MIRFSFNDEPYDSGAINDMYDILVIDYESDGYNGYGCAVGIKGEYVDIYNLSHCSCYGPFDDGPNQISLKTYMESALVDVPDNVYRKSVELLEAFNQSKQSQNNQ